MNSQVGWPILVDHYTLPLPMAGVESGLFQFPPEGTIVEIAFEGGRADKPFIRQTLSQNNTLPDI